MILCSHNLSLIHVEEDWFKNNEKKKNWNLNCYLVLELSWPNGFLV